MMTSMRRYGFVCISAGLLAIPACATEELTPVPPTIVAGLPDGTTGAFEIVFAPPEHSYEEQLAGHGNTTLYHVFLDDSQLVFDDTGGPLKPAFAIEGAMAGV